MQRRAVLLLTIAAACSRESRAPAPAPEAAHLLALTTPDEPGVRLALDGTITDRGGAPVAGAAIHVYQTDAQGHYTPDHPTDEPHARLSGHVVTDGAGHFALRTIRPGGYPEAVVLGGVERHIPAHVHMDVTAAGHAETRVQVVFADDPRLADAYWQQWARDLPAPIVTLRPDGPGVAGSVTIAID